jgi:hypothetical protein
MSEKPKNQLIHPVVPPFILVGDASKDLVQKLKVMIEERPKMEGDGK